MYVCSISQPMVLHGPLLSAVASHGFAWKHFPADVGDETPKVLSAGQVQHLTLPIANLGINGTTHLGCS